MKILHTGDWHMNAKLGRQSLNNDICSSLQQIAAYLETYDVDVMIVAGDVLEKTSRITEMKQAINDIKSIFLPFLERGGTILAISGNHDNEVFFETLRDALDLVAPGYSKPDGTDAVGRLYIAPNAKQLKLADKDGNIVQFVMMPYPTPRAYLSGENINYKSIEEKNQAVQSVFKNRLAVLESRLDKKLPSVLVSHINVRGINSHSLYKLTEVEDVIFEQSDIPTHWAYVAFGHIHKPQSAIESSEHIRYAGSIIKMDGGERNDNKSVVLFEVDSDGRVETPQILPLETTPIHWIEITDPDTQLSSLATQYADADDLLIYYTLQWDSNRHNRDDLCQKIERIFPRWYERKTIDIGKPTIHKQAFEPKSVQSVVETVRDYLTHQLQEHLQREEVMQLAEELLAEEVQN